MLIMEGEYRGMDTVNKNVHLPLEIGTWQASNILDLE